MIETTLEINVTGNVPDGGLDPMGLAGARPKLSYGPRRTGELNGFPVYRTTSGDEILVLTRSTVPPWVPVTREEYANIWMRIWQKKAAGSPGVALFAQVVERHRETLAKMTAEERRMPARHFPQAQDQTGPPLPAAGSSYGVPVVKANPQWYAPALPRTAFQLITLRFRYAGDLDPDRPALAESGDASALRVWEALRKTDWKAASAALTRE